MAERQHRPMDWEDRRVRDWITRNRGVLTRIAVQYHVSPQFVQALVYGRSTANPGHEIEAALRQAGWPGIRRKAIARGV